MTGMLHRVLVIGSPGAGKSTFSQALARRTSLPPTHLGAESWRPGWVRPPTNEWEASVRALIAPDAWILDGNYTSTVLLRSARADTVVVLDVPRWLCLYRAVRRAWSGRRPDRLDLGREPLDLEFLRFIWSFPAVQQRQLAGLERLPDLRLVRLRSGAQARAWLGGL